ncbi:hypothetical protein G6M17_13595 [Agrobacterium tumefaciens]|uniref:hypothetical protein n=1 Tax=Rhizobium/Agrobacterium group TaxID=227290 RepID=UPI0013A5811C|nr:MULTISPECIES: hypothetical protein [Rhizobium/Agrobacterium group]MBO0127474.1 hypothetical protein [Agrobacterium sp. OT33]MCZ7443639.1 hypothetical protein [Rhizobium rhizogenes]NSX91823.1 hypothetical protein [Agrobacterium tumefaciens]NSZ80187.1 hypothetical protein [Agrobacterium tumefaciens]NTE57708.1 hypothetical protein [Agrobacterium tumefaciens]
MNMKSSPRRTPRFSAVKSMLRFRLRFSSSRLQKISIWVPDGLARFSEIIYMGVNHASGRREHHLAPDLTIARSNFHVRTAEMVAPAS